MLNAPLHFKCVLKPQVLEVLNLSGSVIIFKLPKPCMSPHRSQLMSAKPPNLTAPWSYYLG